TRQRKGSRPTPKSTISIFNHTRREGKDAYNDCGKSRRLHVGRTLCYTKTPVSFCLWEFTRSVLDIVSSLYIIPQKGTLWTEKLIVQVKVWGVKMKSPR